MRDLICWCCLLAVGCGAAEPVVPTGTPKADEPLPEVPTVTAKPGDPLPKDLRTRTTGSDWPGFLGPDRRQHLHGERHRLALARGGTADRLGQGDRRRLRHAVHQPRPAVPVRPHRRSAPVCAAARARPASCYGNSNIPPITRISTATATARAAARSWTAIASTSTGPRACCTASAPRTASCVWKVDTIAEFDVVQNFFGVGSTPVIEGDLLIAQVGGSPKGSDPARNLSTGPRATAAAWSPSISTPARSVITSPTSWPATPCPVLATIDGRRWCFVFARGGLVGLEPASGKVDFHFPWRARILESVNASNPVVVGDRVFISEMLRTRQRSARS